MVRIQFEQGHWIFGFFILPSVERSLCSTPRIHKSTKFETLLRKCRGRARTQAPTTRNYTVELPTFAVIAGVSPSVVQCKSLTLEETPR